MTKMKRAIGRNIISISAISFLVIGIACIVYAGSHGTEVKMIEGKMTVDPEKSFSFVVLPDTQKYSEIYKDIFCNQTTWITENLQNLNIVFVSQLGDIVNNGGAHPEEWATASSCMGVLDGTVPYGIIPGNHDTEVSGKKESGFASYDKVFPVSRFEKNEWHGGSFSNYQNNYQIINVHGMRFLFLNLEIEPSNKAIAWAQDVVNEHNDSRIILTTHKYLYDVEAARDNEIEFSKDGNTGEDIWKKLVHDNCSIFLVLSGHYNKADGENRLVEKNKCGEGVYQTVQDYQSREMGGNGRLRIYVVTPSKKKIEVFTYSPYINEFENDRDSKFIIPFN